MRRIRGESARRPFSPCRPGVCDVPSCNAALDRKRKRWTGQALRWADKCFCVNPDLLPFVPGGEFLPYSSAVLGPPGPIEGARHRRLRILHAPTNRAIKGTSLLLAASRQLESTHPHELDLVEGASHDEAVRRSAEADIVVDQVRIGWYGGLAMEAMASGRPTVAFLNDDDLARIPAAMRSELPIVNASPESLPERLAGLLENAALRRNSANGAPNSSAAGTIRSKSPAACSTSTPIRRSRSGKDTARTKRYNSSHVRHCRFYCDGRGAPREKRLSSRRDDPASRASRA